MPRKHKITFHSQKAVVAKRMEKKEKVIRLSEAIVQSFAPWAARDSLCEPQLRQTEEFQNLESEWKSVQDFFGS